MNLSRRIAFSAVVLLGFLAAVDIAGRIIVRDQPPRHDGFAADEELGWILPAGQKINWRGSLTQVNALGLRGMEPYAGNVDTRMLFLGDSSIFGDGVQDDETMPWQMEQMLGGRPAVDIQNGGVPGYTCFQSLRFLKRIQRKFTPDVLIIYNMHSDFRKTASHDRLVVDHSLGILSGTGIARLLSRAVLKKRIKAQSPNVDVDAYTGCLDDMVSAHGNEKVVFVVPITEPDFRDSPFYKHPDPDPPGERLSDYREAMKATAAKHDALLVDAIDATTKAGLLGSTALIDLVHPTVEGHRVIARAISTALREKGWVHSGPAPR